MAALRCGARSAPHRNAIPEPPPRNAGRGQGEGLHMQNVLAYDKVIPAAKPPTRPNLYRRKIVRRKMYVKL